MISKNEAKKADAKLAAESTKPNYGRVHTGERIKEPRSHRCLECGKRTNTMISLR